MGEPNDILVRHSCDALLPRIGLMGGLKTARTAAMNRVFHVVVAVALVAIAYGVLDRMLTYQQGACLASILVLVAIGKVYLSRKATSTSQK